jgi:hypothetical protein
MGPLEDPYVDGENARTVLALTGRRGQPSADPRRTASTWLCIDAKKGAP